MQNLYNELVAGATELDANGNMITKAPTSLMLRAARTLKQLADINDGNMHNMQHMQNMAQIDHESLVKQGNIINELTKEVDQLKTQQKSLYSQLLEKDENLRNDNGQQQSGPEEAGVMGDGGTDDRGSDQGSEGGIQAEDSGLGSN